MDSSSTKPTRVMIVAEPGRNRDQLESLVRNLAFEPTVVSTSEEALSRVRKQAHDILTDGRRPVPGQT